MDLVPGCLDGIQYPFDLRGGVHGWSRRQCIPHGGHLFAIHIAAGLGTGGNESYPGVFQPFGGFTGDLRPENSRVRLPQLPGIGYEGKADLAAVLRELAS